MLLKKSSSVSLLFLALASFTSCAHEEEFSTISFDVKEKVASAHNDCLRSALLAIKEGKERASRANMVMNRNDVYQLANQSLIGYVNNQQLLTPRDKQIIISNVIQPDVPLDLDVDTLCNSELTPMQLELTNELTSILQDNDTLLTSLHQRINTVREKAINSLNGNELDAMLHGCKVADSTLVYWYNDYSNWAEASAVTSSTQPKKRGDLSWKKVGIADTKGAISGCLRVAVGAYFYGGLGPAGWTGAATVIAVRAGKKSLQSVIKQLW